MPNHTKNVSSAGAPVREPYHVVIMGAPGSGKSVLEQMIQKIVAVKFQSFSMGNHIWAQINKGHYFWRTFKTFVDNGYLLPDELIIDELRLDIIQDYQVRFNTIWEGVPRNKNQAKGFLSMIKEQGELHAVDPKIAVLKINIEDAAALHNMEERGRKDDEFPISRKRLETYKQETEPMTEVFDKHGIMVHTLQSPIAEQQAGILAAFKTAGFNNFRDLKKSAEYMK